VAVAPSKFWAVVGKFFLFKNFHKGLKFGAEKLSFWVENLGAEWKL